MKKRFTILFILLTSCTVTFAQELRLIVSDKPLNDVLNSLNVEISFDDKALSIYRVSVSQIFASPEEAINYLLENKPFKLEKIGSVFVITPVLIAEKKTEPVIEKKYIILGELYDQSTGEPLPYAYIQTERGMTVTNESGMFTLVQTAAKPMRIQVHYIGFGRLDTVLNIGRHRLSLSPEIFTLGEVTVSQPPATMLMQAGKTSGEIRINHQTARYMPGSADNSVFTLLRMMPGVRASGEPSEDLIVWGSNWSESRLIYDGFTIFGMKSFNDQIGSVNPYMAKDIRLRKGGYDAAHGNRIGAIAEVTGNEGNFDNPSIKANISNYTANIFASAPIKHSSVLSIAYRQTIFNIYDNVKIGDSNDTLKTFINPKHNFRDMYLKYAGRVSGNDSYYVSLYGAEDHFKPSVTQNNNTVSAAEKNRQFGVAATYNRVWNSGNISKLLLSYSKFLAAIDNVSGGIANNHSIPLDIFHIDNSIQELSLKAEHNFSIDERQQIQIGGVLHQYAYSLDGFQKQIYNPTVYITDNIMFGKLSLQAGLRADWIPDINIYVQPRISARYAVSEELTATASFGLYKQFVSRVPFHRSLYGGYHIIWLVPDSMFLSSIHSLAGLAYSRDGWLFSVEGYLKKNQNDLSYIYNDIYAFDNTFWGADVYLKKEWLKHTLFGSYSLVNAQTLQNSVGQEIKSGAIISFNPLIFSATYVYGTGFPYLTGNNSDADTIVVYSEPYSRLDLSLIYRLQLKNYRIQAGASLLNVFDTNNIKYSCRISEKYNLFNVYTKTIPRTLIAFFEFLF